MLTAAQILSIFSYQLVQRIKRSRQRSQSEIVNDHSVDSKFHFDRISFGSHMAVLSKWFYVELSMGKISN